MSHHPIRRRCAAMAVLAAAALSAGGAAAQAVGVLAAVNRDVVGERPAEPPRPLVLNERLILNERITTTAQGGGQVLFLDQTSLTLAPDSDIVLDRYLYDPDKDAGELTVSVLRGAMRFVGGRISKTGVATIRTPSATIGIRGGIGHLRMREGGGAQYMHIAGISSTIETEDGERLVITREGGVVEIAPMDEAAGGENRRALLAGVRTFRRLIFRGVATPAIVRQTFGVEAGSGGGGVSRPVTRERVRRRIGPIMRRISAPPEAVIAAPISTTGKQEAVTVEETPLVTEPPSEEISDENIARNIAREATQLLDGVAFNGTWTALAGLADDSFVLPQQGLSFQMAYSLARNEGIVAVELPDTGDLSAPNTTDLTGQPIIGDRFLVAGDEDLAIVGQDVPTQLGGDASATDLALSAQDVLTGSIFIDYRNSDLTLTDFVDGEIEQISGVRELDTDTLRKIDEFNNP